ncbi:MAG: hypothetical protein ACRD4D_05720 [Candidatus Acidiferrales bacterium]
MTKSDIGGPSAVPPDFESTVKRLTLDLRIADRHLVHARLPQRTLEEMSEGVDLIRSTLWAVLNSVADDFSVSHEATALLTSHRMQRSLALLEALVEEIDAGRIHRSTPGLEGLSNLLGTVYKKCHYVLQHRPAPPES